MQSILHAIRERGVGHASYSNLEIDLNIQDPLSESYANINPRLILSSRPQHSTKYGHQQSLLSLRIPAPLCDLDPGQLLLESRIQTAYHDIPSISLQDA
jgi:hypothetical protein